MKHVVAVILLLTAVSGAVSAWAQTDEKAPARSDAWAPKAEDRDRFKLITRVNIFLAERPRIVEDRPREQRAEEVKAPPPPPPDTDRQKVVVGASVLDEQASPGALAQRRVVIFIEDRGSGEVTRLTGPGPFSKGEVTDLGLDGLTYIVGDQRRRINVGQSLTGEMPASVPGATPVSPNGGPQVNPAPTSTTTPPGGAAPANPEENDILRRLRERRNSE